MYRQILYEHKKSISPLAELDGGVKEIEDDDTFEKVFNIVRSYISRCRNKNSGGYF